MNNIKTLFKNSTYTFFANFMSFIINALVVLIIPKLIGVSEYGYFQFYILLSTYALYFHFGWCDGVYLRYVGNQYKDLDKQLFSSQLKGLGILSALIFIACILASLFFSNNEDKQWIYIIASFAILLSNLKIFTSVTMQAVNNMRDYSIIILAEKAIYVVVLIIMLTAGIRNFRYLIISDIVGKLGATAIGLYFCKEILAAKISFAEISRYFTEAINNLRVGIFLLISNIASIFITGIVQFSVESEWNIETFSKVSLTFNMSKMLLVVINAMSVVLIPLLKHMNKDELRNIYKIIRSALMIILGALLIIYYPMKVILIKWLPQYKISLYYMALLFPMCLFESKTSLLLNTYFKALRAERKLCFANITTVIVSVVSCIITVFILHNLNLAILSIPYLLAFRCLLLEFFVGRMIDLKLIKDALIEIGLATVFILLNWFIDSWIASILYFVVYLFYLIYIKDDLITIFCKIRSSLFKEI